MIHQSVQKLPAVSGSSGRLIVAKPVDDEKTEKQWPGRVFEDLELDYTQAMLDFVQASEPLHQRTKSKAQPTAGDSSLKEKKRALRQEKEKLRTQRREIRQQRQLEDQAFKALREEKQKQGSTGFSLDPRKVAEKQWKCIKAHRKETVAHRQQEDRQWREKRLDLRQRIAELPVVTVWIAILVIVDNCTRQCLGLPLSVAGPKVTSEIIVEALKQLLPNDLPLNFGQPPNHITLECMSMEVPKAYST